MKVSPALAQLLADRRKTLNGRVAAARARSPNFDQAALSAFLVEIFDPLLEEVLAVRPDGGPAFVETGFDMVVALVEHGWAGEQKRALPVRQLWRDVAPGMASMVAANPRATLGALTNAAIKLAQADHVRLPDWMRTLQAVGARAGSAAELRAIATLAAWRAGAAHLRQAALAVSIDPALACEAVGATGKADWTRLVSSFAGNRWWTPDASAPADGHRLGAFTGFGGRFPEPPRLGVLGNGFILSSAGEHFLLEADAYGATLRPVPREDGEAATPARPASLSGGGQLRIGNRTLASDWPADGLFEAETADSVAIVSRFSHAVRVLPKALS